MTEKRFTVQRIYKGMDNGVKYYDWCVMKDDTVILRLDTRMDCIDVVEMLNELEKESEQLQIQLSQLAKVNREGTKKVQDLAKENERVKHNYDVCVYHRINDANKISDLEKKNEQLKEKIKNLNNI